MTDRTESDEQTKHFKRQLDQLNCPFTEDIEEVSWVKEMMFKPGEPRIRLLQWLFTKLDPTIGEVLDPHYALVNTKVDSRIQRLLFVASNLGLCSVDDTDLIKGITTLSKQTAFMSQLLDNVCLLEEARDPKVKYSMIPGLIGEGMDISSQFLHDCQLVDKIATETSIDRLYSTHFHVLPPDVKKHIERNSDKEIFNLSSDNLPPLPDIKKLSETAESLSDEIAKQTKILEELKQKYIFEDIDPQATAQLNKSLRIVLCDLGQLILGYSSCFETELKHMCNTESPTLTELGPTMQRVGKSLAKFSGLLNGLGGVKHSHRVLCRDMLSKLDQALEKNGRKSPHITADLKDSVSVLEESNLRLENDLSRVETSALHYSATVPANVTVSSGLPEKPCA